MRRVVLALALLAFAATASAQTGPRPNFVVILTDDHGIGDVSAYVPGGVRTPSIDRLAAQGMRFTAMRANATVCSPTRAALLTGRYPDRVGVPGVIRTNPADSWGYLDPSVPTLAELLRRQQLAGAGLPADIDAVSLLPALRGQPMPSPRELYFVRREGGAAYGGKSYEAIIRDGWKLMQNDPYSALELYHLREDPREQYNRASEDPGRVDELRAALRRHVQRGGATPWQPPQRR
jgi:arylsulfatase A-like enzyme